MNTMIGGLETSSVARKDVSDKKSLIWMNFRFVATVHRKNC